jgi:curved DNA-binding protein CbpA
MSSHYDVLGVAVDADLEEVRRAYYRKAQLLHPDRTTGSSAVERQRAEAEMKAVNVAWNTLRNPDARRRHDVELGLVDAGHQDEAFGDEAAENEAAENEAAEDHGPSGAEPQPQAAFRRGRVPVVIVLVLIAGIVATGIAMVAQADNPSPRWNTTDLAELRSAAISGGMTAPQADCFVRAVTSRYGPSDDFDRALVQQFAEACR